MNTSEFDDVFSFDGIQTTKSSSKNRVDIVFVIDNSGTMASIIDGVKNHVTTFVKSLEANANNKIDYRLGFVFQGTQSMLVKEFTSSVSDFVNAIEKTTNYDNNQNEYGLFGIDIAADFPWEEKRHKFIIVFTDEDVDGGNESEYQLSKFSQLLSKLETLRIKIYYLGVNGANYEAFKKVPGTYFEPNDNFDNVDFSDLLSRIGKSVSQASGVALQQSAKSVQKDLYNVQSYVEIVKI